MGEKCFKGFKKGLVCKGKQYAENTVFEEQEANICLNGMHYCKNPFDVLDYYDLLNSDGSFNEFAEVEPLAEEKTNDDKKFCTTKLKIGAKLSFSGFIKACVDFVIEKASFEMPDVDDESIISSSGNSSQLAASGYYSKLAASGNSSQLAASGYSSQLAASGNSSQLAASGNSSQLAASGNSSKLAASGYYSKLAASGNSSQLAASGNSSQLAASGYYSQLAASGDSSKIDSTGMYAVVMCAGNNCIAKAKKGSFITLAEWKEDEEIGKWIPVNVVTEKVDGERIKEDIYYKLVDGKFVEFDNRTV